MKKELIIVIIVIGVIAGAIFMNKQIEDSYNEPCIAIEKPFEYNAEPNNLGPPPETYLVKVYVETTTVD